MSEIKIKAKFKDCLGPNKGRKEYCAPTPPWSWRHLLYHISSSEYFASVANVQHPVTKLYRCKVAVKIKAEFVEFVDESEGEYVDGLL